MSSSSDPQSNPTQAASPEDQAALDWLHNVYQGDRIRQFTPRAVITGMLIGGVMSISNLYVGLKTGWGLGVTITACIIAYAVFQVLQRVIPAYRDDHFTVLENYTMSSAASAAGYMASAGLVSALPALYITTKHVLTPWEIMAWLGAISMLGVFMAIPLKRQLINIDQLPFPTGIATAETLKSMHSEGGEAVAKAKSLFYSAIVGALVAVWGKAFSLFDRLKAYALPDEFPLYPGGHRFLEKTTFGFEGSTIMVAAGAIMGIRVGVSLLIGAVLYYGVIGTYLVDQGITGEGYGRKGINSWALWPATAMMVTSGLLAFGMKWRTVLRAFSGLSGVLGGPRKSVDPLAHVEVPGWWFAVGTIVSGAACVLFGHYFFNISWWMGVLAVLITFLLSIVAARATGETDITPIGAMGKITQLMYGVISPGNMTTNLMTASITAGAASHSADLLTDLKSGYLLGGNPRKQTLSQLAGVVAGTIICVPVYLIIAPGEKIGTAELPAPAAQVWAGVAELLSKGIDALPSGALSAMWIGGAIGIVLTLLEEYVPKEHRKWIPSSTGLGIAGVIPAFNSISMFLGALIAWIITKKSPVVGDRYIVPVSSGLIAGESLMAVTIILINKGPELVDEIMRYIRAAGG